MRKFFVVCVALALCSFVGAFQVKFADDTRIKYDGQCFTINGKDTFIYSGAFHYFRCPQASWADRFRKIKAAGFNTVETYVPWNYHEQDPPSSLEDFSKIKLRECQEWVEMAIDKFGLNVIVRPGPYVCSEWDSGGYPQWLMRYKPEDFKGDWLRSDDPTYLAWCRHWFKAVGRALERFQITRRAPGKAGIILFQLENEYDYAGGTDQVHINQVKALAQDAEDYGIEVPFVTCWTHQVRGSKDPALSQMMDCCNFYPRWNVDGTADALAQCRKQQPGAPLMVMELQGGWFSENGGLLAEDQKGIDAAQINNLTLFCIQNGLSALNYYMLFGGTNFGDRTPPNITTSYDYFAPIREDGALGEKYRAVQAIGAMLKEYGSLLARSSTAPVTAICPDDTIKVAVRFDTAGGRYFFVRTTSHDTPRSGDVQVAGMTVHYDLGPFGSKILYMAKGVTDPTAGIWLPKAAPDLPAPSTAPTIRLATATARYDDGGNRWEPARIGEPLSGQGVYDARYVAYRATFDSSDSLDKALWIKAFGDEPVVARLNGKILLKAGGRDSDSVFPAVDLKRKGNELELLLENRGYVNGGPMDAPRGLEAARLVSGGVSTKNLEAWRIKKLSSRFAPDQVADSADSTAWREVKIVAGEGAPELDGEGSTAVYRTSFDLTQKEIAAGVTCLDFASIDDEGWVYVNGHFMGDHRAWDVPMDVDFAKYARVGANNVSVIVMNRAGIGGLTKPVTVFAKLPKGLDLKLSWTPDMQGVREGWSQNFDDTEDAPTVFLNGGEEIPRKVSAATAPTGGSPATHLMCWYNLLFDMPSKSPDEPTRRLLIDGTGSGFIYINGHALGRFWQQGPQREYFLPASWLNWGDKPNRLAISLRPVNGVEALRAVSVAAYPDRRNQ